MKTIFVLLLSLLICASVSQITYIRDPTCQTNENEIFNLTGCACAPGYFRMFDKFCRTCPEGTVYQPTYKICVSKCSDNKIWSYALKTCICAWGTYNISGHCIECEKWQQFDTKKNKCYAVCSKTETYDVFLKCCRPSCDGDFEYYSYAKECCQCLPPYNRIDGQCKACPYRHVFIPELGRCIPSCGILQKMDKKTGKCVCEDGFYNIQGRCGLCNPNQIYSQKLAACLPRCGNNQVWSNNKCICLEGYHLINGTCHTCNKYEIYDQQKCLCVPNCGPNAQWLEGPKICECLDGFYNILGKCGVCPHGQKYDSWLQCCVGDIPQCQKNEEYDPKTKNCVCIEGYYKINGVCTKCEKNEVFEPELKICRPLCGLNEEYSLSKKECICKDRYYRIHKICGTCKDEETYDSDLQSCNSCGKNEIYLSSSHCCVCKYGYYLIKGECGRCDSGFKYNEKDHICVPICNQNEVYTKGQCICVEGYYRINQICSKCPLNSIYNPEYKDCQPICQSYELYSRSQRTCVCKDGYYKVNGHCSKCNQGTIYDAGIQQCKQKCKQNEEYSFTEHKCVCIKGLYEVNNQCILCTDGYQYDPVNKKCILVRCPDHQVKIQGVCGFCPPGTIYNATGQKCDSQCKVNEVYQDGKCVCVDGYVESWKGICVPQPKCPTHSYFSKQSFCCVCIDGYVLYNDKCILKPICGKNSFYCDGQCYCDDDYVLIKQTLTCETCQQNQIYNGEDCICKNGYTRNSGGKCVLKPILTCSSNQHYDNSYKTCLCEAGYLWMNGNCHQNPTCTANSTWNGKSCECDSGFIMIQYKCKPVEIPKPSCPQNGYFNGVFCTCNDGHHEIFPGVCGKCASGTVWDGNMCKDTAVCQLGYTYDSVKKYCVPKGINCGANSEWNGMMCVCNTNCHYINGKCSSCPENTMFDGQYCSPIFTNDPVTCGSNEVLVNGKCTCREGWYNIDGKCLRCPDKTEWNGSYCKSTISTDKWCLGKPYTEYNSGRCHCIGNYLSIDGCCINGY